MATIYDVAKAAGVSAKTVSRVLNQDAPVGRETREKVEQAIHALGYVPSNAARMMRSNRSGIVGLITGAISQTSDNPELTGLPDLFIVQGIQQVMAAQKKTLMIADTAGSADNIPHLLETFRQHRAEGIIYVADYHKQIELPDMAKSLPIVLANCFDTRATPSVLPDDKLGQKRLVERLIKAGHHRIALLRLPETFVASDLRYQGYCDAMSEASIPFDPALVPSTLQDDDPRQLGQLTEALKHLLNLDQPPTVICCGNDKMALRVYGILRSMGLNIPEDISIAGYDNYTLIAETLYPALTTVELPYRDMGRQAAELILDMIKQADHPNEPALIQGDVYWRSSVTDFFTTNVKMFQQ